MNIFATDPSPIKSAQYLDSKRVVKMVLESAQMLSTAITLNGGCGWYKIAHKNHPCTKAVANNSTNYKWLLNHFIALCNEYTKRYHKVHKCAQYVQQAKDGIKYIPYNDTLELVNCAANKENGINYKHIDDVYLAYKLYLCDRWETDKRTPKWD